MRWAQGGSGAEGADGVPLQGQETEARFSFIPLSSLCPLSRDTRKEMSVCFQGASLLKEGGKEGKIKSEDSFFLFSHLPFSSHFKSLVSNLFEDMIQPLFYIKKVFFFFLATS